MKRGRSPGKPTKAEAARIVAVKEGPFDWSKVDIGAQDDCWPWNRSRNVWGYGYCQWRGKCSNASRAAYEAVNGPVGDGLVVCHRCDNPACCNPSHLFAATQAENLADCRAKGRQRYRYGADHHRVGAKLTPERVLEARRLYSAGVTQTEIGRRWGVHSSTISRAVRGEKWSHIE